MSEQLTLDLFDEISAADAWKARFHRVEVVIDEDLAAFDAGSTHLAWVCPGCGELELTPYSLRINHGFDPTCERASRSFEQGCSRWTEVHLDKPFHRPTDRTDTHR
ncbi:hypothetical protein [Rhodococcus zopfii]|uniref:hypothetical protein n=1 Tax=Rhodococcus zopfii TaxID=43772 RepID=UPI0035271DB1